MRVKIRVKKTYVFNEKGNSNPDALIYVNKSTLRAALSCLEGCWLKLDENSIDLVDCYVFTKHPPKRYFEVPSCLLSVQFHERLCNV